MLSRIEKQLKRRFAIGSQVSEHSIIQDFTKQVGLPRAAWPAPTTTTAVLFPDLRPPLLPWHWAVFLSRYGQRTGGCGSGGATSRLPQVLAGYSFPTLPGFCG